MRFHRCACLGAFSASSLLIATQAIAQAQVSTQPSSTAAPAQAGDNAINDIVVTAERRSSTVQTTPLAIVAVSGDQLAAQHVTETTDLGAVVPNLQIVPIAQTFQINIRGVGSNFFDPRGESSVSQGIDGLSYARPPQAGGTFFDIDRIEVLKGPQGTLYGTNAAAGAVNLITNHPADQFEVSGEFGFGNYSAREYAAMINVPITDTLALRVAGKGNHRDGFIADYYGDAADDAFRVSGLWKPTARLTVYAAYNFSNFDGHGSTPVSYPCDPVPYSNMISNQCAAGTGAPGGTYALTGKATGRLETTQLNIDYALDFATLTSVTGYMSQSITASRVPNGTFFVTDLDQRSHDVSQEVRLAGKGDGHHRGSLAWVIGGYYSSGDGSQTFNGIGLAVLSSLPQTVYAAFAQGTYGITDSIRATAGVRYTHDRKGVVDNIGSALTFAEGRVNYRAALEADVARHSLLYASVSTGYEAGGANAGAIGLPLPPGIIPPIFRPETITSYEVGSKNTFMNGKLRLNADFYYYKIKNFQSYDPGFIDTLQGGPALQLQNIGDVDTYGIEVDGVYVLTPHDRFTASGSLARGHFGPLTVDSFAFGPMGPFPVAIQVPSGYELTNLPKQDFRLGYDHTFDLGSTGELDFAVNTHISGSYLVTPASNDPYDRQPSFTSTDLSLRFTSPNGITVTGWVKNVENSAVTAYGENPGFHLYYPAPPRTYGATVGFKFH